MTARTARDRPRWRAGAAMGFIAAIAAAVSYSDGLTEMRHAGARGGIALLYPLLPDGLIVICLIALYEAARGGLARPRWATAGLVLGAGLTLAQNVGAGAATGVLLAVIDGFVPVVFFVAAEVLIWTIRHRHVTGPPAVPGTVPADVAEAAKARLRFALAHGFRVSNNELCDAFPLTRAQVTRVREEVLAESNGGPHG